MAAAAGDDSSHSTPSDDKDKNNDNNDNTDNENGLTWIGNVFTAILQRLVKFSAGNARSPTGVYRKRVQHDCQVPKIEFQDKYHQLKQKYRTWVARWSTEANMDTDPRKHVYEDILIATFLICLWEREGHAGDALDKQKDGKCRKRPRFVDMGCGNGLLVHILTQEGYGGYGLDIAARDIWKLYGSGTRLQVCTVHAPTMLVDVRTGERMHFGDGDHVKGQGHDDKYDDDQDNDHSPVAVDDDGRDVWLLGNHSDELTPWIPIIAARSSLYAMRHFDARETRCKFFLLPCCFHDLAGDRNPFGRTIPVDDPIDVDLVATATDTTGTATTTTTATGTGTGTPGVGELRGKYGVYLRWIQQLCERICHFEPVAWEWLRIPSTKNIALLGRRLDVRCWVHDGLYLSLDHQQLQEIETTIVDYTAGVCFQPRLSDREKNRRRMEDAERKRLRRHEQDRLDEEHGLGASQLLVELGAFGLFDDDDDDEGDQGDGDQGDDQLDDQDKRGA